VSVLPNAGLPVLVDGKTVFPLEARAIRGRGGALRQRVSASVSSGDAAARRPEHISAHRRARVAGKTPKQRRPQAHAADGSSLYNEVELKQDTSCLLIVGERTNANGSRKFKRLLAD
jgi:5-methyltetrahydrofolate--homocysteine methyltransferase